MSLEIKKFDMSKIQFRTDANGNPIIITIGKRDTGRRWLVNDPKYYDKNNKQNEDEKVRPS